jgi:thiol:disulfide interchange protein DsbA
MNRRAFSLQLTGIVGAAGAALAGLGAWPTATQAQGNPAEGTDYVKLKQPVAMQATGKVEVVEFFWYACPHCFHFEPTLEPWVHKLPADVHFRRVPVGFNDARKEFHQRIYFTLEAMNQVEALHTKVFERFHVQHKPLDREADVLQFAQDNGLDPAKFKEIFNGFSMQTKIAQADRLTEAYEIDGVPEIGIQGRYVTAPSMSGTEPKSLLVADFLINQVRKAA